MAKKLKEYFPPQEPGTENREKSLDAMEALTTNALGQSALIRPREIRFY
jgi:hypothetical protein